MSNQDLEDLFRPGDGGLPPYLAGRKEEKEYFQRCIKSLKNRKPIGQNLIVYGPRGNGKTALLGYLQKETLQKEKGNLDILWATPNEMEHPGKLIDLGYVWKIGGYDYEPGIPSLMTYIQGYSQVQGTASEASPLSERI